MHLSYQTFHYTRNATTIQNLNNTEYETLESSFSSQKVTQIGGVDDGGNEIHIGINFVRFCLTSNKENFDYFELQSLFAKISITIKRQNPIEYSF